jgi:hypothetical protein
MFPARVIQKATYQGRLIYETTAEYLKHILSKKNKPHAGTDCQVQERRTDLDEP